MNCRPQHPKARVWSQIRARIGSAWNDLFYDDRPENVVPASGFTLRKLFAVVWGIAAIAFTAREDLTTVFSVGVPLAMLGYAYLSGLRLGCFLQGVFWSWLVLGWYCCYRLPYVNTPVPLPESAQHIRWNSGWSKVQFRFEAPVEDCILTAQKHLQNIRHQTTKLTQPEIIDRATGIGVSQTQRGYPNRADWLDLQNIQKGLIYNTDIGESIWIDTEKGILYFYWSD